MDPGSWLVPVSEPKRSAWDKYNGTHYKCRNAFRENRFETLPASAVLGVYAIPSFIEGERADSLYFGYPVPYLISLDELA